MSETNVDPCSVCCGAPLASGRECVCRGDGTLGGELIGLRLEVFECLDRIEAITAALRDLLDPGAEPDALWRASVRAKALLDKEGW